RARKRKYPGRFKGHPGNPRQMQFDDVILGRRSIRGFKPDPVPRALIAEIIGLAMRAPSSMNTQPWNFYIITGEPLDRIRAGNTERVIAYQAFMKKYLPGEDSKNEIGFAVYSFAYVMGKIIEACGDDLTRENLLYQATHLNNVPAPSLLP